MKLSQYNNILNKYVDKYGKKFKELKDNYCHNVKTITVCDAKYYFNQYKIEVKNFLRELIDEFDEIKKYKFVVFLNGSFSRGTNTLFSDIDINYFYDNKYFDEMIQYEYKINYIIKEVMNFRGMDRIHSMVVYLPLISSNEYEYFSNNRYPLFFEDGIIYYSCRENAEKLMFEMFNSTRNIDDVICYLNKNDDVDNLNEWTNCFELVYDNGLYNEFLKTRKVCKCSKNILDYILKCEESFSNDKHYFDEDIQEVYVSDLKYYYKSSVIYNVYFMFAIAFRLNKNLKMINFDDFINSNIFDDNFCNAFYSYINCIQKLQLLLDFDNMDLSSHSSKIINIRELNVSYFELTGNSNIISELNELKKELYAVCIDYLHDRKGEL